MMMMVVYLCHLYLACFSCCSPHVLYWHDQQKSLCKYQYLLCLEVFNNFSLINHFQSEAGWIGFHSILGGCIVPLFVMR